jgi:hypothetical protein
MVRIAWHQYQGALQLTSASVEASGLPLPSQHARNLAEMRQRADAPPGFVAECHQEQRYQGQDHRPEDAIAHGVGLLQQRCALNDNLLGGEMEWAREVVRTGQRRRQRIPKQGSDQDEPCDQQSSTDCAHLPFWDA